MEGVGKEVAFLDFCVPGLGAIGAAHVYVKTVSTFRNPISFREDQEIRFRTPVLPGIVTAVGCEVHVPSVHQNELVGLAYSDFVFKIP